MSYLPIPLPDRLRMSEELMETVSSNYLNYMRKRHSVRDFSREPISDRVIRNAIAVAASAPSGANQQPWHFVVVKNQEMKAQIRREAEYEEQKFYAGAGGDEWISALEPIGTGVNKQHLTDAPALIIVFGQRYGLAADGSRYKHYYVNESVGIAVGFLISALHHSGLVCLEHTPNPMKFLNQLCDRPKHEKPMMILPVGYPSETAEIPQAAKVKKPISEVLSIY
ncbi:MAG: nitroreductase family protein [Paracoccaceae bacterium]|nr:nitroreductase family protein [Paracoccaceae bacterium]